MARAIHQNSPRRGNRFVALNCSAIPETLLEAEIFGHVRGAFTGAVGNRQGRLEQAHKGTLFLDEVGTMSPALQMKLLRVLQEREFERVGESHTTKVDVRVIAATNSDLGRMVAEGSFREDLYYRLNVIPVRLPALRERREDIALLVQHFLEKYLAGPAANTVVSQEAMRRLMAYSWPGNVRQLENAIERASAFGGARGQIDVGDLPAEVQEAEQAPQTWMVGLPQEGLDLPALVTNLERDLDQPFPRADGRQQGTGRPTPRTEADDAGRKAQAHGCLTMPPRFAYWTILIDGGPTAFRARERDELMPTFTQLKRTNTDIVMKWFSQGRLWESPEAQQAAARKTRPTRAEPRGRDWRPGGAHRDPRARFKKKKKT